MQLLCTALTIEQYLRNVSFKVQRYHAGPHVNKHIHTKCTWKEALKRDFNWEVWPVCSVLIVEHQSRADHLNVSGAAVVDCRYMMIKPAVMRECVPEGNCVFI